MKLSTFFFQAFFDEIPSSEDNVQSPVGIHLHTLNHLVDDGIVVLHLFGCSVGDDLLYAEEAKLLAAGTTMQRISRTKLGTLGLPKPPLSTQDKIVSYLNEVIKKIDICIENKLRLSELLQESRTSIICSAITNGINTICQLKDSGTEWLGYIPSHWKVVPAKALFAQSKETRHETDIQLTASQKYGIISQEDYMEKQSYKIVLADKGLENWKHVEPNDFIISLRSFQGGLEISYIPGCITWHYIVLKPKAGVEPEYFKWLFKSPRYIQALQRTANFIRDGQDLRFLNFVQGPLPLIPTLALLRC